MYETGCQGLVTAAVLNALGCDGNVIHVHNGNNPEKQAVQMMDQTEKSLDRILSVSVFNLLHQVKVDTVTTSTSNNVCNDD